MNNEEALEHLRYCKGTVLKLYKREPTPDESNDFFVSFVREDCSDCIEAYDVLNELIHRMEGLEK